MSNRWLFLAVLILFTCAGGLALQNHRTAQQQVAAILAADAQGIDVTVPPQATVNNIMRTVQYSPIQNLRNFVAGHMNASVHFVLTAAYSRAETAAKASASTVNSNAQLYVQAQQACGGHTDSITQARCVQDYVSKRLVAAPSPSPVTPPDQAAYQYTFTSPIWAPDAAGALALGGTLGVLGLGISNISARRRRNAR